MTAHSSIGHNSGDLLLCSSCGEPATAPCVKSYTKEQISDLIDIVFDETEPLDRMQWAGLVLAGNVSRKQMARVIRHELRGCPEVPSLSTVEKWLSGATQGAGSYETRLTMKVRSKFDTEIDQAVSLGRFVGKDLIGGVE